MLKFIDVKVQLTEEIAARSKDFFPGENRGFAIEHRVGWLNEHWWFRPEMESDLSFFRPSPKP